MKNISRRVFIKGLAVAGVAAAASTVLAGCNTNMIPGVDDDQDNEVTEPAATNKYTFTTVDGDTLVISAPSAVTTAVDAGATSVSVGIALAVENNLGGSVKFAGAYASTAATNSEDYLVVLTSVVCDKDGDTVTSNATVAASTAFDGKCILGKALKDGDSMKNLVYGWDKKSGMKDWGKITVTAKVYKKVRDAAETKYMYAAKEVDKHEFTYTR